MKFGLVSDFGFCGEIGVVSDCHEGDAVSYCDEIALEGQNSVNFREILIRHVLAFVYRHDPSYRQRVERDGTVNELPRCDKERVRRAVDLKDIACAIYGGRGDV